MNASSSWCVRLGVVESRAWAQIDMSTRYDRLGQLIADSFGGRVHGDDVLTRCHNMALEMLQDRGCTVVDACQTAQQLAARVDDCKPILRTDATEASSAGATLVFVDADERVSIKLMRTLCEAHPHESILVVSVEGPTTFTKREMSDTHRVEFWLVRELLMNPTRHALVPRHTIMSDGQVQALCTARCIRPGQFPKLLRTDIICRWHRFPKDGVVRIERTGIAHEEGDYFRRVV